MPKSRHIIRPEVKAQILKRLKEEGIPVAQLAEEHGITTRAIYHWLSKGMASERPTMLAYAKLKKENQLLKQLVGHMTLFLETEKKKTSR
jgi:transposase-like protein